MQVKAAREETAMMGYEGDDPADRVILVVGRDIELRAQITAYLADYGYVVRGAGDTRQMDEILAQMPIDLIVFDDPAPDDGGVTACCRLARTGGPRLIVVSSHADEADRVRTLECGADDFLAKPFNPRELLARVKAVLRSTIGQAAGRQRRFLGVAFRIGHHQLRTADGEVVALTPVELSVLSALVEHPGRVLSRDEILDKAYSEATEVFDRAVDVQISRLRRKLSACSPEPAIRTHRHAGYQFIARVD